MDPDRLPLPGRMPPITTSWVRECFTLSHRSDRAPRRYADEGSFTTTPSRPNLALVETAASTSSKTGGTTTGSPAPPASCSSSRRLSRRGRDATSRPPADSTSNRYSCTGVLAASRSISRG